MLTYNGTDLKEFFKDANGNYEFIVNDITGRGPLSQEVTRTTLQGRAGSYFHKRRTPERTITVAFTMLGKNFTDLRAKVERLNEILYEPEKPAPMIFSDESDKTYYGIIDNASPGWGEIIYHGQGALTFLCPDPHKYGPEQTVTLQSGVSISNNGNTPLYPKLRATYDADATFFAATRTTPEQQERLNAADGGEDLEDIPYVLIGQPDGIERTAKPRQETILHEPFFAIGADWVAATDSDLDDGVVDGSFTIEDGQKLVPAGYGTATTYAGWHGPALKRTLTETIQDYRVETWFHFQSDDLGIGRVELILQDANSNTIGKIALKDVHGSHTETIGNIRAGSSATNEQLIDQASQYWRNFYGHLILRRVGQSFYAHIGVYDIQENRFHSRQTSEPFFDVDNQFQAPLAQVVVHIGKYKTYKQATPKIGDIRVERINSIDDNTEVPSIIKADDVIGIDCDTEEVFKNGNVFLDEFRPGSTFFTLEPGYNFVECSPTSATVEAIFRERWL
jgi:predicted phage tail component-like protein